MLGHLKTAKGRIGGLVFFFSLAIYLLTMAQTTSFWDCGEFIACSYTMGVPHPPGSPLYILLGRVFSLIPFESIAKLFMSAEEIAFAMPEGFEIAWRVNLMSPLMSAFTALFAYLIIIRFLEMWQGRADSFEKKIIHYASGSIGALAFAFSDSQWFNSVEAEVYSASVFFTAFVVWLILKWSENSEKVESDRWILLISYLIGLALGVHLLNLLAIPTIFLIMYFRNKNIGWDSFGMFAGVAALIFVSIYPGVVKGIPYLIKEYSFFAVLILVAAIGYLSYHFIQTKNRNAALFFMSILLVVIGYSTYSTIFIRSTLNPVIDENAPDTPEKFVSYLNRDQYGDWQISVRRAPMWEYQIKKMYVRYFSWQFIGKGVTKAADGLLADVISFRGLLGLPFLLGLFGLVHHARSDWKRASSVLALFIMTGLAIVIYLNQEDPQPRERDYAYTGSFFAFAIWIGIGASYLLELTRDALQKNQSNQRFAMVAITSLLLFIVPGNMLAFNYHEHSRKGNFVAYDYSKNILETCAPNAILFTNGDNDTFPLWFLQNVYGIRTDVRIVNLSLLNTPWYIKQLRDEEPKVSISLTDPEIDALAPKGFPEKQHIQLPIKPEVVEKWNRKIAALDSTFVPDSTATMKFTMTPTLRTSYGNGIRVQDLMILHILSQNQFERPVYYAVTVANVNKLGLSEYMQMDGLAFRVLPVRVGRQFIDTEVIEDKLFNAYDYRNLNNPNVHYNDNIIALLGNYRSAFMTLHQKYSEMGDKESQLKVLDKMSEVVPEDVIPAANVNFSFYVGRMYKDLGRPEELIRRIDRLANDPGLSAQDKIPLLRAYSELANDQEAGEKLTRELLDDATTRSTTFEYLVSQKLYSQRYEEAKALLDEWLQEEPENARAQTLLKQAEGLIAAMEKVRKKADGDSSGAK